MKKEDKLYAIYKNGIHKGNERGKTKDNAILHYIRESLLSDFIDDYEFLQQYSAKIAINGVHYHFIKE